MCRFVRCRIGKDGKENTKDLVLAFFEWLINAARMKPDDARRIIDNELISITRKLQWDKECREYRRPTYKTPILIEIKNLRSVSISLARLNSVFGGTRTFCTMIGRSTQQAGAFTLSIRVRNLVSSGKPRRRKTELNTRSVKAQPQGSNWIAKRCSRF